MKEKKKKKKKKKRKNRKNTEMTGWLGAEAPDWTEDLAIHLLCIFPSLFSRSVSNT